MDDKNKSHERDQWKAPLTRESPEQQRFLNNWLVSYSDFMTILAIFFLAMYGYAYLDAASLLFPKMSDVPYSAFTEMIQKLTDETGSELKVQEDVDKITIEMNEKILFKSGMSEVTPAADRTLKSLALSLNKIEGDVIVQGHTDNVPIHSKRFKSNWELSAARAFSVIQKLTDLGVSPKRLSAWGFGESRPVADNSTAEGRSENRRIEIVVLKKNLNRGSH